MLGHDFSARASTRLTLVGTPSPVNYLLDERSLVCLFWLRVLTVSDVLRRNLGRRPLAPAVIDQARHLTYRQLAERVWSVAQGLISVGVRPGETVAILCGNGIFSAEAILGAMAAGAIAVPLSWRWSRPELEHGLRDSQARVVLADQEFSPAVQELVECGRGAIGAATSAASLRLASHFFRLPKDSTRAFLPNQQSRGYDLSQRPAPNLSDGSVLWFKLQP